MNLKSYSRGRSTNNRTSYQKKPLYPYNKEIITNPTEKLIDRQLALTVTATNWILHDQRKQFTIGLKQHQQREIASLTKIMTTIVALQLIEKYGLQKQILVRISRTSAAMIGTTAKLKQNYLVKLYDLLYGCMLPSGNDAAYLIAQVFGLLLFYQNIKPQQKQYNDIQSIDLSFYENTISFVNKFLKQMNRKAKQLKMNKTSFANPHGLTNILNVSTPGDMLVLCKYSCKNQEFRKMMSTQKYSSQFYRSLGEGTQLDMQKTLTVTWKNTNKLLNNQWEGIKTGNTTSAGGCLASLKNGIYIIVLNSIGIQQRFEDTVALYEWYQQKGIAYAAQLNDKKATISSKQFQG